MRHAPNWGVSKAFLEGIRECAVHYGWEMPGCGEPTPQARQARVSLLAGLGKLRRSQSLLEEASKHFAQAGIDLLPEEYKEATRLSRLVRELLEDGWFLT